MPAETPQLASITGCAVALGIGLLVGLERERRKGDGPDRAPAGIRTFALVGLTGGLAMALGQPVVLGAAAVFVAALAALAYQRSRVPDPGLTTEFALFAVFLLGAAAVPFPGLAAGLGVVVTVLLAARSGLHAFVQRGLTEQELHDGLFLAAAALVVLPLLPNRTIDPWNAFNPRTLWMLVVLVMGIEAVGYIAQRALGARLGLPLAGLAGGFVSSVATIAALGARAKKAPELRAGCIAGALLSTMVTYIYMAIVLVATAPPVLPVLGGALIAAGAVALAYALLFAWRGAGTEDSHASAGRAFSFLGAVRFAATLSAIMLVSALMNRTWGSGAVVVSCAVAGLVDTHAAAISAAALVAAGQIPAEASELPILAALTTNAGTKAVVAAWNGGRGYGVRVVVGLVLATAAQWVGWVATHRP